MAARNHRRYHKSANLIDLAAAMASPITSPVKRAAARHNLQRSLSQKL
jgi:hypothetical protein